MKHQYFGCVSDYRKYSILKNLINIGNINPLICWMLTLDDKKSDGSNKNYLHDPVTWEKYDQDIFNFLHEKVIRENNTHLSTIENSELLKRAIFYNPILTDALNDRQNYFNNLHKIISNNDLIFLDPDNGIETESIQKGGRYSSKYIFLDEIGDLWNRGKSLLIYQHFPRVERISYMIKQLNALKSVANAHKIYALKTSTMAYFALANKDTADALEISFIEIQKQWDTQIDCYIFDTKKTKLNRIF